MRIDSEMSPVLIVVPGDAKLSEPVGEAVADHP